MIPLRNNGGEWFAKRLSFIIAENCRRAGIPKNDTATVIRRDNRIPDGVGDRAKFRFRYAQAALSDTAFGESAWIAANNASSLMSLRSVPSSGLNFAAFRNCSIIGWNAELVW